MNEETKMSKEERIGFHKGSISTLIAERTELLKMVSITEALIQAHAKELENLGVRVNMQSDEGKHSKSKKDLDRRVP
jgi:hypothetical protein